ncbi:hypothetical protein QQS21_008799 [Conoideocrella luteorostrata]|uniref:polynucleotide adenylyltransferase n=1 Tax=Conoideocrella luteorostrata TaxID=1105319 RepID=A0AAJ0CI47_9HYPO|nr:hypothetical protein QQS21_008799 [Conoideocrella luteorostrata]
MQSGGYKPETLLENHLRGLIFTNQAEKLHQPTSQTILSPSTASTAMGDENHDTSSDQVRQLAIPIGARHECQAYKSSNRRPNQAQRRQMSIEFSTAMGPQWYYTGQNPSQFDLQQTGSASHPVHERRSMYSAGAHGDQRLTGPQPEPTSRSTLWSNSALSHPSRASEFHPDSARRLNWSGQDPPSPHIPHYCQVPHRNNRRQYTDPDGVVNQAALLDELCYQVVSSSEIDRDEIAQKEIFRQKIETICRQVISDYERKHNGILGFHDSSVVLKCFGSLASGFATKTSDMDLGLFSPSSKMQLGSPGSLIPRLVEKGFLEAGYGARLLSRTRVPIIKLCEKPTEELRTALVAEREKWENGTSSDLMYGLDDQEQDQKTPGQQLHDTTRSENEPEFITHPESELSMNDAGDGIPPFSLGQSHRSSLVAYHGLARRVLRRVGGRDITISNHREFTAQDWAILNRVCQAFVQGLRNTVLRKRLQSYQSLSLTSSPTGSRNRSLAGVFSQVEGEQLILNWECWPTRDEILGLNSQVHQAIRTWMEVQQRSTFGIDPLSYNMDIQSALEKLKSQPAIQLMQLRQDPQETPAKYHSRLRYIVQRLDKFDADPSNSATNEIVSRYIAGIHDEDVRNEMASAKTELQHPIGIDELGQKHRCLQLARELERAIGLGLYDQHITSDINKYIQLLRLPLSKTSTEQCHDVFRIPVTVESSQLLTKMKLLSDPHKLIINQPRNKYKDSLEFPAGGVGVQCDINFSADLALQNTLLLRCYSLTDSRVRPMVLFIKHWAKVRGINSGYRGTLSSYGYVLMVLHYLVNIARPFVCPNLQKLAPPPSAYQTPVDCQANSLIQGYSVQFWRNEPEIMRLAAENQLTHNAESIGSLLRDFFEYFAQGGLMSHGFGKGFDWGRDVLSLRTYGGLLPKQEKGWTGAKTVFESHDGTQGTNSTQSGKANLVKEVKHRYLFAIEDPFELDHNVARTVTHNGIVSIREEFRRAWRIIRSSGSRGWSEDLLQDAAETTEGSDCYIKLLEEIHGPSKLWTLE